LLTRFAVVVPAYDEEELLPACLAALSACAAPVAPLPVELIVAADSCTDHTIEAARAVGATVIEVAVRNVGAARAAGMDHALRHGPDGLWLATTDADSRVPAGWLSAHLRYRAEGAQLVVGTVAVDDWARWPESVRGTYDARYRAGIGASGHRHVHGANLGCDATAYENAGGFAPLPHDEDRDLVARMLGAGARVRYDVHRPVITSARLAARAPDGFAAFLGELAAEPPAVS
jgi:glycosyltransferase involved in cell wall biosynthesis